MVEKYQDFIKKASVAAEIIEHYQDVFETFNTLFPDDSTVHQIRGKVTLVGRTDNAINGNVDVFVEVNRIASESDLGIKLSLKVGKNNFFKIYECTLPNPNSVTADDMTEAGKKDEVIEKIVDQIKRYDSVRTSFAPCSQN